MVSDWPNVSTGRVGLQRVTKLTPRLVLDAGTWDIVEVRALDIAIFAMMRLWKREWDIDPLLATVMIGNHDEFFQAVNNVN